MGVKVIDTGDGAHSLYHEELDEHYHSVHGAVNEALHVFIQNGWRAVEKEEVNILEMGFGTGLNFMVTYIENQMTQKKLNYYSLEKYPLEKNIWEKLNYLSVLKREDLQEVFKRTHECVWNELVEIDSKSFLKKIEGDLEEIVFTSKFDLVFYDAFGPRVQPHLWTTEIFSKIYDNMSEGGVLVTYCAKGQVRRNMQEAGFRVERLPGPPKKREMLRAIKE